jgi:1-deoxy-D-xylulose-5-phosphate synthase
MLLENGRYPATLFEYGKAEYLQRDGEILLIGYGNGVGRAVAVADMLKDSGIEAAVLDLRFVKPLDIEILKEAAKSFEKWFIFSDGAKMGGVASAISEEIILKEHKNIAIYSFEYEDKFITHGNTKKVEESLGLLPEQIKEKIYSIVRG